MKIKSESLKISLDILKRPEDAGLYLTHEEINSEKQQKYINKGAGIR